MRLTPITGTTPDGTRFIWGIVMVMRKRRQVAIATDHFWCHRSFNFSGFSALGVSFMPRVRHCVECPKCHIRYLIAFSPYSNGSYVVPTADACWDEYILYCGCSRIAVASRWSGSEVQTCEVSKAAYERGYGTAEEISVIHPAPTTWALDVSRYITNWRSMGRRKNSGSDRDDVS